MARIICAFIILAFSVQTHAIDQAKCSTLLNQGWWKKYEYGGIDQPLTKATKKHGMTKATSVTSTEGSTATLDPGYWSNITTSETQSTSSWGDCSAIGLNRIKHYREQYFKLHQDEIYNQIAMGRGEHLEVIANLSLCDSGSEEDFSQMLQGRISAFIRKDMKQSYGQIINQGLASNRLLQARCLQF